ncbi:OstA-like protein [Saccharicrinis aurantiacus]|uniref:OstA-like protein n=1 Tax=Saccharicrinis aurantiacus TaxID=1849719 RepID=UPI002490B522|nr:OstA-like protein [Saccharicrinis aurantiacus]
MKSDCVNGSGIKNKVLFLLILFTVIATNVVAQKKVDIKHADFLRHNEVKFGADVRVLIGNVEFKHGSALMYCDTAYQYENANRIYAIGNVHIIQNDTLNLWGNTLDYDGQTSLAKVRGDVKLQNKETTLTTEFLDFDRINNIAYYFNDGKTVNKETVLTSKEGYYYPDTEDVFYKDSVEVVNPKYTMFSDTLKYNTITEIARIEGPTFIVSDSNTIYAEDGYYDTAKDFGVLRENAYVEGEQTLYGDTIYYNRNTGLGEVFNSMELHDTINNTIIKGEYGYYNEQTKYALATEDALMIQIYELDTLYLHGDTLQAVPIEEEEGEKLIKAYRHVKYFRRDIQGRCDSMVFDSRDSTNTFYYDPIMWSLGNQLTADVIKMYSKDGVMDRVDLLNRAFIISEEDTGSYNQIKGKEMTGFVKNNELYKIDVNGNAQTIYYPMDDEVVIGLNKAECSNMTIKLKERQLERIIMRVSPNGTMNPTQLVVPENTKLVGFYWLDVFRPKVYTDIFTWEELPKFDRGEDRTEYNLDNTYDDFKE